MLLANLVKVKESDLSKLICKHNSFNLLALYLNIQVEQTSYFLPISELMKKLYRC